MAFRLRSTSDGSGYVTSISLQASEVRISIRNGALERILIQFNENINNEEIQEEEEEIDDDDEYDDYSDSCGEAMADEPSSDEEQEEHEEPENDAISWLSISDVSSDYPYELVRSDYDLDEDF